MTNQDNPMNTAPSAGDLWPRRNRGTSEPAANTEPEMPRRPIADAGANDLRPDRRGADKSPGEAERVVPSDQHTGASDLRPHPTRDPAMQRDARDSVTMTSDLQDRVRKVQERAGLPVGEQRPPVRAVDRHVPLGATDQPAWQQMPAYQPMPTYRPMPGQPTQPGQSEQNGQPHSGGQWLTGQQVPFDQGPPVPPGQGPGQEQRQPWSPTGQQPAQPWNNQPGPGHGQPGQVQPGQVPPPWQGQPWQQQPPWSGQPGTGNPPWSGQQPPPQGQPWQPGPQQPPTAQPWQAPGQGNAWNPGQQPPPVQQPPPGQPRPWHGAQPQFGQPQSAAGQRPSPYPPGTSPQQVPGAPVMQTVPVVTDAVGRPPWRFVDVVITVVIGFVLTVLFSIVAIAGLEGSGHDVDDVHDPVSLVSLGLAMYLGFGLAVWGVLVRWRRATWSDIGFRPTTVKTILTMLPLAVLMLIVAVVMGVLQQQLFGIDPPDPSTQPLGADHYSVQDVVLLAVLTVGLAPFFEEMVFRGVLFQYLRGRYAGVAWGAIEAVVISAVAFAALHASILVILPMGIVLALVMYRTNSLWASIALHAFYNGLALAIVVLGTIAS